MFPQKQVEQDVCDWDLSYRLEADSLEHSQSDVQTDYSHCQVWCSAYQRGQVRQDGVCNLVYQLEAGQEHPKSDMKEHSQSDMKDYSQSDKKEHCEYDAGFLALLGLTGTDASVAAWVADHVAWFADHIASDAELVDHGG